MRALRPAVPGPGIGHDGPGRPAVTSPRLPCRAGRAGRASSTPWPRHCAAGQGGRRAPRSRGRPGRAAHGGRGRHQDAIGAGPWCCTTQGHGARPTPWSSPRPPPPAAALLGPVDRALAAMLGRDRLRRCDARHDADARHEAVGHALDGTGFLVPAEAGCLITACTWLSSKWPELHRPGDVLLRASTGRFGDDRASADVRRRARAPGPRRPRPHAGICGRGRPRRW